LSSFDTCKNGSNWAIFDKWFDFHLSESTIYLFVCLFNSYIVSLFRENMRRVIYNDVSCHLCTIKAKEWWSSKFQIVEDDFFDWFSFHIVKDDLIQIVICNRFTFVLMFRFSFAFALSRSYHRMICADFKTTKSFVKRSQNDQVFSDRTFWILFHVWSFYFVFNPCTRKRHSAVIESIIKSVMMIDDD
jgi:hypothetical protein